LTKHFQTVSGFGIADLKEGLLRQEPFCTTCPKHNTKVQHITTIQRIRRCLCMDGSIYDSESWIVSQL
jgi:hypothetical protein